MQTVNADNLKSLVKSDAPLELKITGQLKLSHLWYIAPLQFSKLDITETEFGIEEEEWAVCIGYTCPGIPVYGASGMRKVEVLKRLLFNIKADEVILPDNVARRHINQALRNPDVKSLRVNDTCKLFAMDGDTLCNKKKTIRYFPPRQQ